MNSPTFLEHVFSHPNGSSFKLLRISFPGLKDFYIEYPTNFDITNSRLVQNKIKTGLTSTNSYKIDISGVGFKAIKEGSKIHMYLGKAVPTIIETPIDINVEVKKSGVELEISGPWLEKVAQFASKIYQLKPAFKDKYKHKGLKLLRTL
jgi:ribosomal protein L6P/L9E